MKRSVDYENNAQYFKAERQLIHESNSWFLLSSWFLFCFFSKEALGITDQQASTTFHASLDKFVPNSASLGRFEVHDVGVETRITSPWHVQSQRSRLNKVYNHVTCSQLRANQTCFSLMIHETNKNINSGARLPKRLACCNSSCVKTSWKVSRLGQPRIDDWL